MPRRWVCRSCRCKSEMSGATTSTRFSLSSTSTSATPPIRAVSILFSAVHSCAAVRRDPPDPLPEPPPIPYEYLHRLGSSIHDSAVALTPATQAQILFELRNALSDEDDPIVLDDVRNLLRALRRRADATLMTASENLVLATDTGSARVDV